MMKELTDIVKCIFCSTEKLDKVFMEQQQQNQGTLKAIAVMMNSAAEDRARADQDRARADEKITALLELMNKRS